MLIILTGKLTHDRDSFAKIRSDVRNLWIREFDAGLIEMETTTTELSLRVDQENLRLLSKTIVWRWLAAAAFDWAVILASISVSQYFQNPIGWIVAIFVVGNRQHALAVLMHEGTHFRVCGNRRANDWLSDFLCGYTIFMPTDNYRVFHLAHHKWLDTPRDPEGRFFKTFPKDASFPQNPLRFIWLVVRDLTGLWPPTSLFLMSLIWGLEGQKRFHLIPIFLIHSTVAIATSFAGWLHLYLLFWLLPMVTVFTATFRFRAMTEHHGIDEAGESRYCRDAPDVLRTTRSIGGWIGPALFAPHGINYHLEHHLFPSVPFYNLPQLSRMLATENPKVFELRVRKDYWAATMECLDLGRRRD